MTASPDQIHHDKRLTFHLVDFVDQDPNLLKARKIKEVQEACGKPEEAAQYRVLLDDATDEHR